MYLELILTVQTVFMGIFLYLYIHEKRQQERFVKEIMSIVADKMIYYLDDRLDIDTLQYCKRIFATIGNKK